MNSGLESIPEMDRDLNYFTRCPRNSRYVGRMISCDCKHQTIKIYNRQIKISCTDCKRRSCQRRRIRSAPDVKPFSTACSSRPQLLVLDQQCRFFKCILYRGYLKRLWLRLEMDKLWT